MTAYAAPKNIAASKVATIFQFAVAITPTDNTAIGPFSGLYVGGAGDVTVMMKNGDGAGNLTAATFKAVPAGTLLPIAVQGVNATGTTATNILGLG